MATRESARDGRTEAPAFSSSEQHVWRSGRSSAWDEFVSLYMRNFENGVRACEVLSEFLVENSSCVLFLRAARRGFSTFDNNSGLIKSLCLLGQDSRDVLFSESATSPRRNTGSTAQSRQRAESVASVVEARSSALQHMCGSDAPWRPAFSDGRHQNGENASGGGSSSRTDQYSLVDFGGEEFSVRAPRNRRATINISILGPPPSSAATLPSSVRHDDSTEAQQSQGPLLVRIRCGTPQMARLRAIGGAAMTNGSVTYTPHGIRRLVAEQRSGTPLAHALEPSFCDLDSTVLALGEIASAFSLAPLVAVLGTADVFEGVATAMRYTSTMLKRARHAAARVQAAAPRAGASPECVLSVATAAVAEAAAAEGPAPARALTLREFLLDAS